MGLLFNWLVCIVKNKKKKIRKNCTERIPCECWRETHCLGSPSQDLLSFRAGPGPLFGTSKLKAVGTAPQPTHPSVLSLGLADHWQAQMRFLISFSSWLKQPPLLAQTPPSTRTCWDPTLAPPWPLDLLLWSCPTAGGLPGPGHRGWLLLCILCDRGCSAETHSSWPSIMWKALLLGGGECTLIS